MIPFETVGHPKPFRACFIINDHKVETFGVQKNCMHATPAMKTRYIGQSSLK